MSSKFENCVICSKKLSGRQRMYCSIDCKWRNQPRVAQQKARGLERKRRLISAKGYSCSRCGFSGSLAALSFHHIDGKLFQLSRHALGRKRSIDIADEADKCILLCANCHHDLHSPEMKLERLSDLRVDFEELSGASSTCIVCNHSLAEKSSRFCSVRCKNAYHQNYRNQQTRGLIRKLDYVQELGGKCSSCGYDANLAALVFHHTRDKEFALDLRSLANRSEAKLNAEVEKCILLCANCHMALHYPQR